MIQISDTRIGNYGGDFKVYLSIKPYSSLAKAAQEGQHIYNHKITIPSYANRYHDKIRDAIMFIKVIKSIIKYKDTEGKSYDIKTNSKFLWTSNCYEINSNYLFRNRSTIYFEVVSGISVGYFENYLYEVAECATSQLRNFIKEISKYNKATAEDVVQSWSPLTEDE